MVAVEGARYRRQPSDTTAAYRHIPLLHGTLMDMVPFDCVPVVVELRDDACSLVNYVHPERAFYVFGPEDGDVPNRIAEKCRDRVYVPTQFCMNLAATANVILYDRLAKHKRLIDALKAENERLREALKGLYDDQVDYLTLNHLGGMDNHWMVRARAALAVKP
jgi:tRNA C32,U32 (ribose-2'-O)-methylase TrmJ